MTVAMLPHATLTPAVMLCRRMMKLGDHSDVIWEIIQMSWGQWCTEVFMNGGYVAEEICRQAIIEPNIESQMLT